MLARNEESETQGQLDTEAVNQALGFPLPRFVPQRFKPRNVGGWTGHLSFASDLIAAIRPRLIIELGTHWGEAYFTFCQTVEEHGLSSLCYAVDHWQGDEHAGRYGEEVFEEVREYNERYYRQFSYLLRSSFDDAISQFADDSIELLHVDGLHTYEAASHDFRTWLPKVKSGGIVMLHDICPKHQDFGVWRLWDEIKSEFPNTFEFHHSWGLGVMCKGDSAIDSPLLRCLFSKSPQVREELRHRYVVYSSHLENLLSQSATPAREAMGANSSGEVRVQVFPFSADGYREHTSKFLKTETGKWSTLTFELPDGLGEGPLRVDPAHEPGLIEISELRIDSLTSGELLWSSNSSPTEAVSVGGTASLLPASSGLLLLSFGDDPQVRLTLPPSVRGPVKLTVSLRVSSTPPPAPEIIDYLVKRGNKSQQELAAAQQQASEQLLATKLELNRIGGELTAAKDQIERATAAQEQLATERDTANGLLRASEHTLLALQQSRSWKITQPLRQIRNLFRPGSRKAR